ASVEAVDDCARVLVSALSDDYHHGLAQDIQDHVVRVYEACNFQDLAGQRIGKVIATLTMVEEQLTVMIENCNKVTGTAQPDKTTESHPSGDLLNGPRLDGAARHTSQQDIARFCATAGRRIKKKQMSATDATPAARVSAPRSDVRSIMNARM